MEHSNFGPSGKRLLNYKIVHIVEDIITHRWDVSCSLVVNNYLIRQSSGSGVELRNVD